MKFDGYRLVARKSGGRVHLWSRNATDFTDHFSDIAAGVAALPFETVTLDGEAVVFHLDGHSDFAALRSRAGGKRAVLVAFDLLEIGGEERAAPLQDRRARLSAMIGPEDQRIQFSEQMRATAQPSSATSAAFGIEGILSKRLGSRYWSGRSSDWLKAKNPAFVRR